MELEEKIHFNKQYLENEVRNLSERQESTLKSRPTVRIDRLLKKYRKELTDAYRELAFAAKQKKDLSSAAEWLIDNFYIIQEQIVQLKEDLPYSYYKKLPRLTSGQYEGYPRVYQLIQLLANISDNIIDDENAATAVQAYQERNTLKLGELWAVPILIRLVLLARLTEKVAQLMEYRQVRLRVDSIIERIIAEESDEPGTLLRKLPELSSDGPDGKTFLSLLGQRLQAQGLLTDSERKWFDYKLRPWNTTLDEEMRYETQRTSRLHLSIQNAISSLRDASEKDWSGFVENCSIVERILRLDPSGYYPNMDFETRDRYRKTVEKLSAHSKRTEPEIAEQALLMAEQSDLEEEQEKIRERHIGFYLIDEGFLELAEEVNYSMPITERLRRWAGRHPAVYFSSIAMHLLVLLCIVSYITGLLEAPLWMVLLTLGAAFFPALDLSVVSTNRILSLVLPPRMLPKLEITGDIRDDLRTIVVVPTLISSPEDVRQQLEALEVRALANPNRSLQFVLISDYNDAPKETMPDDEAILQTALDEIKQMNNRYASNYGDKFYLLHRKRCWNEKQNVWMGWERKRGKLEEFNKLLQDSDAETTFTTLSGDFRQSISSVPVKYVLTLDADTGLPPGSALELISAAAHPLNHPELNEQGTKVEKGYAIFQPRISITPKAANKTSFAKIFSGNVGIDPYTTAVSDVYQDLFGEGVYTGKGLYNVKVFEEVLGDHFPENAILSHDLLESIYLRTALLTDIELFDDYPTTYLNYSKRNHRWIRGDWQILYWLFRKVPGAGGSKDRNPANIVSRWKVFDNLRRSLNPVFLLLFLLAGWFLLPGSPIIWTAAVLGITAFPIYSSFSLEIFRRPARVKWKLYLEKIRDNLKVNTQQSLTVFLFMPHQAYVSLDAIFRTLWRMFIADKNLLEWTSASQVEKESRGGLSSYLHKMLVNIVWGGLCVALVWIFNPQILWLSVPFALGWMIAPILAYELSRRQVTVERELSKEQREQLKLYARRTWHYFERFVNEEHSWLPPDNFQEEPFIGAVGRTSPTNMGLALVASCSAYEFGYITLSQLIDRLGNMLGSMKLLERHEGHFFNWYSTKLGEVLKPRYISTVDSGNLAASLLVVKQVLLKLEKRDWLDDSFWDGLLDTVKVLKELNQTELNNYGELNPRLNSLLESIEDRIQGRKPGHYQEWMDILGKLHPVTEEIAAIDVYGYHQDAADVEYTSLEAWYEQPRLQVEAMLKELETVAGSIGEKKSLESLKIGELTGTRLPERAKELAAWCDIMVQEMDFSILYFEDKDLFSIGYNLDHAALDKSTYDQLATEARLASYIAIAKGDVPPKHWFRLSRRLTSIQRNEILLSWGGTMFEYLMPVLFMTEIEETLLNNTYHNVVLWQKNYGHSRSRPWGFSESGYGVLNLELHYQYRAFGAPGLGLRRGLAEDYVVTPYASMLALMIQPGESYDNLQAIKKEGGYGLSGFYEAIDYSSTNGKASEDSDKTVVRMYMAHHQAMSQLALTNVLKDNIIQKYFHQDPLIKSCEVLLQERVPRGIPIKEPRPIDVELEPAEEQKVEISVSHASQEQLDSVPPRTHILSNGKFSTLITHAGTGYSWCNGLRLTRWRADRVQDPYGLFFYVRDLESREYWSMGYQPAGRKADRYDSWFHIGKVQTARVDIWIESFMEVCVSPEDNIELRKLTFTNYSQRPRRLELTSYGEVVLNDAETDRAHPAFSNLFVQTDYIAEHHALIAKRRPRSEDEQPAWLVHTLASEDLDRLPEPIEYETERQNFIGRGRNLKNPVALEGSHRLSGTVGNVPDPVVSMRRVLELQPGEKKSVTFGLGKVNSREEAIAMADHYDNPYATDRVFELASIYGRVELEHIDMSGKEAHYFQKLAGYLLYGNDRFRGEEKVLKQNRRTQSALWAFGISGDYPILIYQIRDSDQLRTVDALLKAHALWRLKGLVIDLVIINEHPASYIDELQDAIHDRIRASLEQQRLNQRGGVFVLRSDNTAREDLILLETVASVVLQGKLPKLDFREVEEKVREGALADRVYKPVQLSELKEQDVDTAGLKFFNGYGGFAPDGKEYVIHLRLKKEEGCLNFPPAPWINVLANKDFGTITSERGSDYTWSFNSRENRLTPWSNDSVMDPSGEAIYIRDEEMRHFWSPTPGPVAGSSHYKVRHGFGYSCYESTVSGIKQNLTKWVDKNEPVKIISLNLVNTGLMDKEISVYRYLDWVLGVHREDAAQHTVTEYDESLNTTYAQNFYNNEFAGRVAFASVLADKEVLFTEATSDRLHFIGRNRSLANPKGLCCTYKLDSRFGAGFEPCAAFQSALKLVSGESVHLYFLLGETSSVEEARRIAAKYRDETQLTHSLEEVKTFWKKKLGTIQVQTPVEEIDIMMNGWLQYQNIACRIWARSGFYQSGGAYGFRDQLQDVSSAIYLDADLAREQILLHAAHQFPEGDVLHWWHPPTDRGTRTRISDDLLWLPYVTALYIKRTGDSDILQEDVGFISARQLEEDEQEAYLVPESSMQSASLYEHCCLAIDRSLKTGRHNLPLIGAGDWNDSMNHVGEKGEGESVWLGFFLYKILHDFIPLCKKHKDNTRLERYREHQKNLKKHLNKEGWDGQWYRRAFYDDGTPIGSAESDECKIDAIAQSWAVISEAAPHDKALKALEAADRFLVSDADEIIRLLMPPFDKTPHNPGYIKGYIPGVRENGGQYTHAALWLVRAFAEMGFRDRAAELIKMLSPIHHSFTKEKADRYRVEPYAVVADIYGEAPLTGMGGWTWYTGSAGWMYRVILESILGMQVEHSKVAFTPRIPDHWKGFELTLKMKDEATEYRISLQTDETLEQDTVKGLLDGKPIENPKNLFQFPFRTDGKVHHVEIKFGIGG